MQNRFTLREGIIKVSLWNMKNTKSNYAPKT